MKKLSENKYWNSIYSAYQPRTDTAEQRRGFKAGVKSAVKKLLGERGIRVLRGYGGYLQWESLFPKYLPAQRGLKAVEIGSAPGSFMVSVHQKLAYDVYGIEYAEAGVKINRDLFAANKLNPDHVFHADFLAEEFHREKAGFFDVVFSRGFIEHFDDVDRIIDLHLNLLKPGGTLVITIPRFRGLNYLLMSFFHRENLDIHNLEIMKKSEFRKLFDNRRLAIKFCDYYGTFNLGLFNTKPTSLKRFILKLCRPVQIGLNGLFWLLLRRRGLENPFTSPALMFIGVKKS